MASSPCFISCPPNFVFCGFWRSITGTNRIFWFWFFIPDNQTLWHESPHLLFIEREISQKLFRSLRCSCRSIWLIPYPSRGVQLGCGYSQGQVMTKSKCQLLINRVRAAFQSWAHWLAPSVNVTLALEWASSSGVGSQPNPLCFHACLCKSMLIEHLSAFEHKVDGNSKFARNYCPGSFLVEFWTESLI